MLRQIEYKKPLLLYTRENENNSELRIYLEKSYLRGNSKDQYFLKLMYLDENKNYNCLGYIYFYLNFSGLESKFIGLFIKPEFRNFGLADLLTSYWVKLCLDNGIYNLTTNRTQRKPALLYLLKKFDFEIIDPTLYVSSPYTINICKDLTNDSRHIYFKNPIQKEHFLRSNINKGDNYSVIDALEEPYVILDQVLVSNPYFMQDEQDAYRKAMRRIRRKDSLN